MSIVARARWITVLALAAAPLPALATEFLDLQGGFQPDPASLSYAATGQDAAEVQVRGCPGFAGAEPAVTAALSGASVPLHVYLVGEGAAGVLVGGPDGISRCETMDQYGIAHVRVGRAIDGQYQIWPLAAEAGASIQGTLLVSEIDIGPRDVANLTGLQVDPSLLPPLLSDAPLDPGAEPAFGRLALPEAGTADLVFALAGGVPAGDAGSGCVGDLTQTRPDATLTLTAPEPVLAISATAEPDTGLLVVAPDGQVYCNDDAVSYNPALVFEDAAPGDYAIWVTVYAGGAGSETVLSAGRTAPEGAGAAMSSPAGGVALATDAEPAQGYHQLPAEGPLDLQVILAGGNSAAEAAEGCAGEIDAARPDAVLELAADEPALWFSATAEGIDTTLVVVGPDGTPLCNDDFQSADPAISIEPAAAGSYAVWVGTFGGGTGNPAVMTVSREAPGDGGMAGGGMGGGDANPFAGHPVASAAEALAVLTEALELGEVLSFGRLEETGPEGLILHDVTLRDPSGAEQPVTIGRIRVGDLDLAGLSASGAPDRFSLAFEDIGYASLASGGQAMDLPVPVLENAPPLSLALSLLPPGGDLARREVRLDLMFEGQLALSLAGQMLWPEGVQGMGPDMAFAVQAEGLALELHDMGFLGAVLREIAAESGETLDSVIAQSEEGLAGMLGPVTPGSPRAQLVAALSAKLRDLDRPGVVSLRLTAAAPSDFMSLFEALAGDTIDPSQLALDIQYQPD